MGEKNNVEIKIVNYNNYENKHKKEWLRKFKSANRATGNERSHNLLSHIKINTVEPFAAGSNNNKNDIQTTTNDVYYPWYPNPSICVCPPVSKMNLVFWHKQLIPTCKKKKRVKKMA